MTRSFNELWDAFQKREGMPPPVCVPGEHFGRQIEAVIFNPLGRNPQLWEIARAELMLARQYRKWRRAVENPHGVAGKHHCVLDVYHMALDKLEIIDMLARSREELFGQVALPPPSGPTSVIIPGMPIGELED